VELRLLLIRVLIRVCTFLYNSSVPFIKEEVFVYFLLYNTFSISFQFIDKIVYESYRIISRIILSIRKIQTTL
jgi:hypothetical protein